MIPSPKIRTGQTAQPSTQPPPLGGLNGRDPLAEMDQRDAYLLDNWLPGTASMESRRGCEKYSSAPLAGPVQTLEVYSGGGSERLLAWAGGKVYDVSAPIASQLTTGLLSSVAITTMFSNAAGAQFLISTTGTDAPGSYDGVTYTALAPTGVTGSISTLNFVFSFKGRLYWGQKDKLGFYYGAVGAISGALSYFDLGQQSQKGGFLQAIASFSVGDTGSDPQDYIVFITSRGEYIVYSGFDPSNASNWALVGRYYGPPPIGKRCTVFYGSELVILTEEGAIPFSQIRAAGDIRASAVADQKYSALTSKLGAYLSAFAPNAAVPGWQGLQYSGAGGWLLLNVPATASIAGAYYHYVMNTVTKAWTRFTNWNGLCFAVYNKRLYFGRFDGYVMVGDSGRLDDGADIRVDCKQAYNHFDDGNGSGFLTKKFQWASLTLSCDGAPPISGKFNVDYTEDAPDYLNVLGTPFGSAWDVTDWDSGSWGESDRTQRFIITLNKGGVAGSLWVRCALQGLTLKWFATQYVFEKTRGLLI